MDTTKHPIGLEDAARKNNVLDAALAYLEACVSVLPCIGKQPATAWTYFQTRRAPLSFVHNWHKRGLLQNVGIVCGAASGNLVIIDLDGLDAVGTFTRKFSELTDTYTVKSGSGVGLHLYFYVDDLPPTTRTKGFELRANGTYVVAPPSKHPATGREYVPTAAAATVKRVPHLRDVVEWIKAHARAMKTTAMKTTNDTTCQPVEIATKSERVNSTYEANARLFYARKALWGEVDRVMRATVGGRNNALNLAAWNVGRLAHGGLTDTEIEAALLNAALFVGLTEIEAVRTIRSGVTAGRREPREIPTYRKGRK